MSVRRIGLAALALLATGCGTIVVHSTKTFSLESIPDNAHFELREAHSRGAIIERGTTPAPMRLQRGHGYFEASQYSVVVSKEGYETKTVEFEPSVSGWYWGNLPMALLLTPWPIVGMLVVDPLNGAMWEIDVPRVVMLEKTPAPPAPASP